MRFSPIIFFFFLREWYSIYILSGEREREKKKIYNKNILLVSGGAVISHARSPSYQVLEIEL